ncbi:variable large family protein [Borrelia coriaceae]|uniref:Variable large protein n=1 Tax=Borrelia coriaceae ATCC 43381 TaxID=1408429 RepID=W5SWI8_9SPIR|nr:variable large family protein [Borrelia coriaceae]AHH11564.1 Variable outer membrane protein [Borrelia coriaceae ATCC 43381]
MKINIRLKSICATLFISLFLSCNNGPVDEENPQNKFLKSLVTLGDDFLSIFTSFGEMFSDTLGFKADPKKSDVKDYFEKIHETVEKTKTYLKKIVEDMKKEKNRNFSDTNDAVTTLNAELDDIIKGSKAVSVAIGNAGTEPIGNVATTNDKKGDVGTEIDSLINGIKHIVGVVLKDDKGTLVGNPKAGDDKKAENGTTQRGSNAGDVGKLFGNVSDGSIASTPEKVAGDAAKAVGAVTGADILQAISQGSSGVTANLANTSPTSAANVANPQDAEVAGAIALRAIAKGGKFANHSSTDITAAVKGVAVSAVTKALDALTIAIKKTIDKGLKKVKECYETWRS